MGDQGEQVPFSNSSRKRSLKFSTKALCCGLPGTMECYWTCRSCDQRSIAIPLSCPAHACGSACGRRHPSSPRLLLLQYPDDLLFREPARLHVHPLAGLGFCPFLEKFSGLGSLLNLSISTGRTSYMLITPIRCRPPARSVCSAQKGLGSAAVCLF